MHAGGFPRLHADDIRTLATSEGSLRYQIDLVKAFADQNLLKLNINKCVICCFQSNQAPVLSQSVRWMDQLCPQELLESVWVIDGRVTSHTSTGPL